MGSCPIGEGKASDGVRLPSEGIFPSNLTFGGFRRESHLSSFSNTEGKTVSRLALAAKSLDRSSDGL